MEKKIILGFDHGGFAIKDEVAQIAQKLGYKVEEIGPAEGESADYPDVAQQVCQKYLQGGYSFGILLCGTGIGISIAANKVEGIRCALLHDSFCATMAKQHNNANFIALGGRVTYNESLEKLISNYEQAQFEGGRHQNRISKLNKQWLGARG